MSLFALLTLAAFPQEAPGADEPVGLIRHEAGALSGYTMFAPLRGTTIYLVDMEGEVVHQWATDYIPGAEYMMENGHLLRSAKEPEVSRFSGGGQGGRLQEIDWDGNLVWDYRFAEDEYLQHHDIAVTPDGTILLIAWEHKTRKEALDAGRNPTLVGKDGMWPDWVVEIEPIYPDDAEIIWEWHAWDHLVQNIDESLDNYGSPALHPELIDINGDSAEEFSSEEISNLQALGYLAAGAAGGDSQADWLHTNGINYNPDLDQIALSVPRMNEIWIIDHSTTPDEAASHEGGISGRGGDLLFRWGNPASYRTGAPEDQRFFFQHDVTWVPRGYPGAGNLLIYNNGRGRADGDYSSVVELTPPLEKDGTYRKEEYLPFEPEQPTWEYTAPTKEDFFSSFISGAQRLPNGNTLICEGAAGRVFEVTAAGKTVWEFRNPFVEADSGNGPPVPAQALFRATRIPADHPGLRGKGLALAE